MKKNILLTLVIIFGYSLMAQSQNDIIGNWVSSSGKTHIQIYKKNDKYFGKLSWMKEPNSINGKPKVDEKNPNPELRSEPLVGLELLKDLVQTDKRVYDHGTVYDPKSGKTYRCKITLKKNVLKVRGFIGFAVFGRTESLYRLE